MITEIHSKESFLHQAVARLTIAIPFLGFLTAVILLWGNGINLISLILCGIMYLITALGLTMGYHRLFTHKSFDAKRPLKIALAIAGAMAAEGSVFWWCAMHRRHHQHSDSALDPHSPHHHGEGIRGMFAGAIHAHLGWMLAGPSADFRKFVPDLVRDKDLLWVSRHYFIWVIMGIILPGLIALSIDHTPVSFLQGILWGGFARIFLLHHATWSVNSLCHMSGQRPYPTNDESRNNALCAIWSLGEGWHNNHHAFPTSARHGLTKWQLDVTYLMIRFFSFLGLAGGLKSPTPESIRLRRSDQIR